MSALLSLLRPLLLAGIVIGGLLAAGYRWGASSERADHVAASARAAKAAQEQFDAERLRGQADVALLQADRVDQAAAYTALEKAFNALQSRPHQLVVRRPVDAGLPGAAGDCRAAEPDPALPGPADPAGSGGPGLTAGAVWMWNSALGGADAPAGACGAADTSPEACDVEAQGITLDDAWNNHQLNARQCAQDRLNHQALIDHICGGQECPADASLPHPRPHGAPQ